MAFISIDFAYARRQADSLEEAAGKLRRMADNQFQNAMQGLNAQWKGDSATAYINKCVLMREKVFEEARNIENIAAALRNKIAQLYRAEQEAAQIAANRSNG